jgi:toxin ParE1/3/4
MGDARLVRLRYTQRAADELERILASISAQSPQGARNVQRRLKEMIALLIEHPLAGQRVS